MKRSATIIFPLLLLTLLLSVLLPGCADRSPRNPLLREASRLLDESPDSAGKALSILDSISTENLSEFDRNYHTLLTVKAHDKLYMSHTGDSAINAVAEFFDEKSPLYPEILFYQGRVAADKGDFPSALRNFGKAAELLENNYADTNLKGKTYWQMAYLSLSLGLDSEAARYADHAERYFRETGNREALAYCLKIKANAMLNSGKIPAAAKSFEEAIDIMKEVDNDKVPNLLIYLAAAQLEQNEKEKALGSIRSIKGFSDFRVNNNYYLYAAKIYAANEMYDSAALFARKLIESPDNLNRHIGFRLLLSEPLRYSIPVDSLDWFMESFYESFCSHIDRYDSQTVGLISTTLNYDAHREARLKAEKLSSDLWLWILGLSIVLLIILTIVIIIFYKNKSRKLLLLQLENENKFLRERIEEMSYELKKAEENMADSEVGKEQMIGRLRENLKRMAGIADKHSCQPLKVTDGDLMKEIEELLENKKCISGRSRIWGRLEKDIAGSAPEFFDRLVLLSAGTLTPADRELAMLIKIGYAPSEVAILFGIQRNSLSYRRCNLLARLGLKEIEIRRLDRLIRLI